MPREFYRVNNTEEIGQLIQQLNVILQKMTVQFQRIEGYDQYTTELFRHIKHTGSNMGFFSSTPVPQADAIADSAGSSAQNQAAINAILPVLRNLGFIASA